MFKNKIKLELVGKKSMFTLWNWFSTGIWGDNFQKYISLETLFKSLFNEIRMTSGNLFTIERVWIKERVRLVSCAQANLNMATLCHCPSLEDLASFSPHLGKFSCFFSLKLV
jgi:hypothetical protein